MNIIWNIIFILSTIVMIFTNPDNIMPTIISASEKAVTLSISLISIYAVWLGIMEICENCGINQKIAKILRPLIKKAFKNPNKETEKQIAINISSNILGMGDAATPSGIKAMQGLDDKSGKINQSMTLLMLLNTSAIQLIPTTVIGLRIAYNSTSPSNIIIPTILASILSTTIGILIMFLIEKIKKVKSK